MSSYNPSSILSMPSPSETMGWFRPPTARQRFLIYLYSLVVVGYLVWSGVVLLEWSSPVICALFLFSEALLGLWPSVLFFVCARYRARPRLSVPAGCTV